MTFACMSDIAPREVWPLGPGGSGAAGWGGAFMAPGPPDVSAR